MMKLWWIRTAAMGSVCWKVFWGIVYGGNEGQGRGRSEVKAGRAVVEMEEEMVY